MAILGQGVPLPATFPYEGQWLVENLLFIHKSSTSQTVGGIAPRFTACGPGADGKVSLGFDGEQLAGALHTTEADIFSSNESGDLKLLAISSVPITPRGVPGKQYIFGLRGKECSIIMDQNDSGGTA
jgi:hypothetical protein